MIARPATSSSKTDAIGLTRVADGVRDFPWLRMMVVSVLLVVVLVVGKMGLDVLHDPLVFPVRDVMVDGDFIYLERQDVIDVVSAEVKHGFFNLDLDRLTTSLETLPWVKAAAVRRVWPETIEVEVVEQRAFAYWGSTGLVSVDGKAFFPDMTRVPANLPSLFGPVASGEDMTVFYRKLADIFTQEKLTITKLWLDERRAWDLELDNGLVLKLGRVKGVERVLRFLDVYASVAAGRVGQVLYVDLRYPNGFSIQWRSDADVKIEQ